VQVQLEQGMEGMYLNRSYLRVCIPS